MLRMRRYMARCSLAMLTVAKATRGCTETDCTATGGLGGPSRAPHLHNLELYQLDSPVRVDVRVVGSRHRHDGEDHDQEQSGRDDDGRRRAQTEDRSEERRVGKECRAGLSAER